jgi:endo-1,4-beta-xylanase
MKEKCIDETLKEGGLEGDKIPALSGLFTFPLGAAVSRSSLDPGEPQHELLKHFNIYVAENDMKPECLEPGCDRFDFTYADKLVNYAEANGKKIRGHVLVWHNQTPDWFFRGSGRGGLAAREELYARMENHIKKVLARYKGRIDSWDVANEVLADDGKPRNSKYYQIAGSYDYILRSFIWAREADPNAKLFLTDYNVEYPGGKQDGFYTLAAWLLEQGAPIDGVGFQGHISVHWPSVGDLGNAIDRFSALGLKVQITELDMSLFAHDDKAAAKSSAEIEGLLQDQACKYRDLFVLFREKALDGKLDMVLIWGLSDGGSWLNDFPVAGRTNYPLLFDRECRPKQAFWALAGSSRLL